MTLGIVEVGRDGHDGVFDVAVRALRAADVKLIDVAYDLGYADPPSFTRAFRRWAGMTPREWRRRSVRI